MDTAFYAENFRRLLSTKVCVRERELRSGASLLCPPAHLVFRDPQGFCSPTTDAKYLGHILLHRSHKFAAGAGYALSRAALAKGNAYINATLMQEETPAKAWCDTLTQTPGAPANDNACINATLPAFAEPRDGAHAGVRTASVWISRPNRRIITWACA
jgi:hypothetical protein